MGRAISRRGWQACLAGVIALGAAWWWQHSLVTRHSLSSPIDAKETSARPFAKLPLAFEPNRGQSDGPVLFLSRNPGYSLFLTAQEAVIDLRGAARPLRLTWLNANPKPEAAGLAELPGKLNYLRGSDPARWQRDIPTYRKVRYRDLYPGIDLIYYGRQQHLEYDLVVAPGADPAQIRFRLAGMDAVQRDAEGALRLRIAERSLSLSKPLVYQETAGGKRIVEGEYLLSADNQVGLKLAAYDASKPLIIDPVLSYSSYLGGSGAEQGMGVAVDGGGNIYMVGQTASADFPLAAKSTTDTDAFVAKFNSAGVLQSAVSLGGIGKDRGFGIAVDNLNSAVYIVGDTDSSDFPTKTAEQAAKGGGSTDVDADAFVAKFNSADLSLAYSTYLGGSDSEEALGVAVDGAGNAYVAGATLSDDFPFTASAYQTARNSGGVCKDATNTNTIPCSDAFVAKYDSSGAKLYATFLGGSYQDAANAIAVSGAGVAYVTGVTYSGNFPGIVPGKSLQSVNNGGAGDVFIAKLSADGSQVNYATYLGGDSWDQGQAIAVDGSGNIYAAGATNSNVITGVAFPLTNPLQLIYGGGSYDAFVIKLIPNATDPTIYSMQYSTYLGGSDKDIAFGIAGDNAGNAYVVGETMSTDFPVATSLQSSWFGGGSNQWGDAFITKIGTSGLLAWSTYLGDGDDDWANSVTVDGNGGIYVAGSSFSSNFPMVNPNQANAAGNGDAVMFKLNDSSVTADLQVSVSGAPDPVGSGETLTYQIVVSNLSTVNDAGGVVVKATLPGGVSFKSATPSGSCSAVGAQVTCNVGDIVAGGSATTSLTTTANAAGDITFTAKVARANQPDPKSANDSASVTTTAAVGSSGGGALSVLEWLVGVIFYLSRRKDAPLFIQHD